jgi:two-component system, LytTR family, response regulator
MGIRTLVIAHSGEVARHVSDVICTHPEFEILANCRDGKEALRWMAESNPDLLLLDMELPGMDGFELLDMMGPAATNFILLSNSSEHAIRAFDMRAIDLVRKPISRERLHSALLRAKDQVRKSSVENYTRSPQRSNRILVRSTGRLVFLDPHDVRWISASDNYVVFHTAEERHVVRMTMNAVQRSLDPHHFVRIHRSTIVNIENVRELRGLAHGDYAVVLRDGTELTLTRSYRHLVGRLVPDWPL